MSNDKQNKLKSSGEAAEKKSSSKSPDSPQQPCAGEAAWIEIELFDEHAKAIADEKYVLVLADGTERKGKTDVKGLVRVEGIDPGTCKVIFPDRDATFFEPPPDAEPPPLDEVQVEEAPWMELELLDERGRPVSGEHFSVDTGSEVIEGTLSEEGRALLTDLPEGTHKVVFPDRDATFFEPPPDAEPPPLDEVQVELAPVLAPETAWVEIELVDEKGNPVAGEPYWIQFPDGEVQEGALDGHGLARIEGTSSGRCVVRFPNIDENDWELAPHEGSEEPGTTN